MLTEVVAGQDTDQLLIEKNLYVASLTSHPEAVDPIMDGMRTITARMQPGVPLSQADRTGLERVYEQLAYYLINHDQVRSFTRESLDHQVDAYLSSKYGSEKTLRSSFRDTMMVLAASAVVYVLGFVASFAFSFSNPFLIGIMPAIITLYLGVAWLFISSLKNFTPALQAAYAWISFGLLALGVGAALWVPYSTFEDVYYLPAFRNGIALICIATTFMVTYVGMRKFAQAVKVNNVATFWPLALLLTVACATGVTFLPHGDVPEADYLDPSLAAYAIILVLGTFISILAFQIMDRLTAVYARAMGWFAAGYLWATIMTIPVIAIILKTGLGFGPKILGLGCVFAVAGPMLLISGYKFKRSSGQS